MPRIGREVITPDGTGTVSDLNIVKETVFVRITNGDTSEIKEYPLEKIEKPAGNVPCSSCEKAEPSVDISEESPSCSDPVQVSSEPQKSETGESSQGKHQRRGKQGHPNAPGKNKDQRKADKNDSPRQNPALGKPVMRENPNRTLQSPSAPESSEKKQEKASDWAEAVRRAIDSIN